MNANSGFDEIDEYVDALLGGAVEAPAMEARTETASPAASDAVATEAIVEAMAMEEPDLAFAAVAVAIAEEPTAPAPVRTFAAPPAAAPAIPAAAFEPLARPPSVRANQTPASHRWLRVAVGSDSYAIELLCVQEVVRVAPIVAMRGANPAVLGVMNLRGRIVPVFDLGLWLGTRCVQPDERSRIVVVERNDELIGVLVTLVEDVVTLTQDRIEPPLPGSTPGPIIGVARAGTGPTVLLDAGALFG